MREIKWTRRGDGYEVSSIGDRRFSAFFAIMPDGRSLEEHYQCDVKGYDPGGTNWKLGKGKPPLNKSLDLFEEYLKLWRIWADQHPDLIDELLGIVCIRGGYLKDTFAMTRVNQAHALSLILNERLQNVRNEN
ncbi:hypothetical protein [Flavobacterium sp.]|jgi:hypothetical protein|uniref:hypothetical protein n=1 Tax=Flavobacterium sp. TaxID=239 RepID=UPI0037BFEED5